MDPRQEPPLFLPAYWTPTDQVIMEDLLLRPSHDASAPLAMTSSSAAYSSASTSGFKTAAGPRIKVEDPANLQKNAATAISTGRWSNSARSRSGSLSSTSSCSGSSPSAFAADPSMAVAAVGSQYQLQLRDHDHQMQQRQSDDARSSKVSDEERRARHRAVQKRFVQRKKEAIKQTKRLAAKLEQQYQLLQIASEQRYLTEENYVLQTQCAAASATNAAATASSSSSSISAVPMTITVEPWRRLLDEHMELVREFYEPISHDTWAAMLRQNLAEYELASLDQSYLTSGLTVMGWHDQRKIDDSSVKFVLSKEFPHVCARELMEKTWRQLCSPATHAQFFSSVFTVRVQVLQVLSDNARVIHRALYNPQTGNISHGLELLCRVRRENEFIIFESAIENNAVHACLGASHRWSQMTVSQVFSPTPSTTTTGGGGAESDSDSSTPGCIFRHGGWLQRFVASDVKYWLMEMFFMALRYESGMVAPIFCLQASED